MAGRPLRLLRRRARVLAVCRPRSPHLRARGRTQPDWLGLLEEQLAQLDLPEALPFMAALCGVEGAPSTELGAQSFQIRLHESIVAVLRRLAAREPTILHLDDLHWADGPTVALLRATLGLCDELPLLVLVSTRPEAARQVAELEGGIVAASVRVELEPLAGEAVREIAAGILGAPPASSLVAELLERTRGNPFFVEEVTRSLVEHDELVERAGEWHMVPGWEGDRVPLTVEGILAARVDALDERERDALEVLSIIGRRADGGLARAVSGEIDTAVSTLVAAGFLEPPDASSQVLAFHHPLIQQVVYSRLLRRRRSRLHSLVGDAAERLYGVDDASVDLFARHFYLGEEPPKAYPYLLRAADRAERLFANEQALTQLRRALELTDAVAGAADDRPELLLRRAKLEETVGRYEKARSLYHEVAATGHLRAAIGEAEVLRLLGRQEEAATRLEQARQAHPDPTRGDAAAFALAEGYLLRMRGEMDAAADAFERGAAAASGHDDLLEGELLLERGYTVTFTIGPEEGLACVNRARLVLERTEDLPLLARTLRILGGIQSDLALAEDDDKTMQQAREALEQAQSLAARTGNAEEQAASLINLAVVAGYLGEYETALQADHEALAAFEAAGLKVGVACAYCNIADHLEELARWEEALDVARQALAVAEEIDMPIWTSGALLSIASAELALGNPQPAADAAEDALARALAHGLHDRAESALRGAINAHEALGNYERVEALRRQGDELGGDDFAAGMRS
ncbi:MAG TPA: tetratricopeptide repeat protein [Gaiellaceae bacterium]